MTQLELDRAACALAPAVTSGFFTYLKGMIFISEVIEEKEKGMAKLKRYLIPFALIACLLIVMQALTQPKKIGDETTAGKFRVVVTDVTQQKKIGYHAATGTYWIVDVSIKNVDRTDRLVDKSMFHVSEFNEDFFDDANLSIEVNAGGSLLFRDLQSGESTDGKLVFDLPSDSKVPRLIVNSGVLFAADKNETASINLEK